MKLSKKLLCTVIAASAFIPSLSLAHHSHASLDKNNPVTLFGVITEYRWQSPHVYIQANVVNDKGELVEYTMESLNPPALAEAGWTKDTFKPGDRVTWYGNHDKDINRAYTGITWIETPDGKRLFQSAAENRKWLADNGLPIPDILNPDAQVEPATEIGTGSWVRIGPDFTRFPMIRGPEVVEKWPLTEKAKEQIARFTEDDNPMAQCIYGGPPRNIFSLMNHMWSRPDANTIVIDRDLWTDPREIHLNADAPMGEPSSNGHSVGRFEDGALIVETTNFVAEPWGLYTGLDSSEQKKLREKYWLSHDGMMLNVELTITDPVYLTEPVTVTHQWKKVPDRELAKAECSLDNAQFYLTGGYE